MEWVGKINEFLKQSQTHMDKILQVAHKEFSEIVTKFNENIEAADRQLDDQVRQLIAKHKEETEKCKKCQEDQEKSLQKLREDTNTAIEKINEKFSVKVDEFNKSLQKGVEDLGIFFKEASDIVNKVIQDNKNAPMEIPKKLEERVAPMKKKFEKLQTEFGKKLQGFPEKRDNILKEMGKNLESIEAQTKKKYEDIAEAFKKCTDSTK